MIEKVEKTFVGFLFSLNNLTLTLLVNFVVGMFYYILIHDGIDFFYIGNGWVIGITIFVTAIWVAFWILSYGTFKRKKDGIANR